MAGFGWGPGYPHLPHQSFPISQPPPSGFWPYHPHHRRSHKRRGHHCGPACFMPTFYNTPAAYHTLEDFATKRKSKRNRRCIPSVYESSSSEEEQDSNSDETEEEGRNDSSYYWKTLKIGDKVPQNAVAGGEDEGKTIYVAKAYHAGDEMPAKVIPDINYAAVSYAGEEIPVKKFKILCERKSFKWVESSDGSVPRGAVPGGITENGETLYVGRARHCDHLIVGKVHPSHGCMFIAHCHGEHRAIIYEVLVYS